MKLMPLASWTVLAALMPGFIEHRLGRSAVDRVRTCVRTVRRIALRVLGRADHKRWSAQDGLETWWDERTRLIAQLVPAGSKVIEFGAGRRQLESMLPPGSSYTPSDLVDRGPGTIVFDLNSRPLPRLQHLGFQVAVFGGVLEYVVDVTSLVTWLVSIGIHTCIVSFDAAPARMHALQWIRERMRRLYYGYMNDLTETQLVQCFEMAHMQCVDRRRWTTQWIYRFERRR
jgi:hypothetical protein